MNVLVVQTDQEVSVTAVVEDASTGLPFDPVDVQFYMLEPDGVLVTIVPTNPSVGIYTALHTLDKRGTYGLQVETDGPDISAGVNITATYRNAWV